MVNDVLLEIKEAERRAEELISKASDDSVEIVEDANREAQEIRNASREEGNKTSMELLKKAKEEGGKEAETITEEGRIKAENIKKSAQKNLNKAVEIILDSVLGE
ncbi:MAG: hypothetical protein ACE5J5_02100 [Candidatus Hydrothermarchaeales archaeon]